MVIRGAPARARIARAIWAYTTKDQRTLADEAGIKYSRLRAIMARENPDEASVDELIALANAAGVPADFALHGFTENGDLAERVAALEDAVSAGQKDRDGLAEDIQWILGAIEAQSLESLRERLAQNPPPETGVDRRRGERRQAP